MLVLRNKLLSAINNPTKGLNFVLMAYRRPNGELENLDEFMEEYIVGNWLSSGALLLEDGRIVSATKSWQEDKEATVKLISHMITPDNSQTSINFSGSTFIIVREDPGKHIIVSCRERNKIAVALADNSVLITTHKGGMSNAPKATALTYALAKYLEQNLGRGRRTKSARNYVS